VRRNQPDQIWPEVGTIGQMLIGHHQTTV
jgi:hypothetical protein